jgi:hypothetical protein
VEDFGADAGRGESAEGPKVVRTREACELRDRGGQRESSQTATHEHDAERGRPSLRAPRPFCVVALRAKVDPGRSVAVLSNGLLAIRMGKAELETPVPCVA